MNALNPLEYQLKPDDQLCYIHIPKTAGSTLTAIADANFDVRAIAPAPRHLVDINPAAKAAKNSDDIAELLTHYRLIRGHFSYNEIRKVLRQPVYITVLRDPVDRVISVYEFFKRAGERGEAETHEYESLMAAASSDLLHFIQHSDPTVRLRTCNYQTQQLAQWEGTRADLLKMSDADVLDAATRSLETFAWVGLTEQFQDSVFLMAYIFGWYPTVEYQNLRVVTQKSRRVGVPDDVIAAIAAQNQLDIALYQHAKHRFERQFFQMLLELNQQCGLTGLRLAAADKDSLNKASLNKASLNESEGAWSDRPTLDQLKHSLERHYERRFLAAHPTPLKTLDFDFRQPTFGSGWHRRNGGLNGIKTAGVPFRWTGPGTSSTLDFPLVTTTDLTVRLHISNAVAVDVLNSLKLTVNAHPVDLLPVSLPVEQADQAERSRGGRSALPSPRESRLLQGVIPRRALLRSKGFVRFTLCVNRTAPLQSITQNQTDTRLVGVAIRRLELLPVPSLSPLKRLWHRWRDR